MKVVYDDRHQDHDPQLFMVRGRMKRSNEQPERAFRLLAAAVATGVVGISRRGDAEAAAATSIPPNCIYVCCDGTCDSWKMCMRCVQRPKPTTTTTIASR